MNAYGTSNYRSIRTRRKRFAKVDIGKHLGWSLLAITVYNSLWQCYYITQQREVVSLEWSFIWHAYVLCCSLTCCATRHHRQEQKTFLCLHLPLCTITTILCYLSPALGPMMLTWQTNIIFFFIDILCGECWLSLLAVMTTELYVKIEFSGHDWSCVVTFG